MRRKHALSDVDISVNKILGIRTEADQQAETRAARRVSDPARPIEIRNNSTALTKDVVALDFTGRTLTQLDGVISIPIGPSVVSSGAPSISVGAAAGTGASVSIEGTDRSGKILLQPGTSPTSGVLATITLNTALSNNDYTVLLSPGDDEAASASTKVFVNYLSASKTATKWDLNAGSAVTGSTLHWYYLVVPYTSFVYSVSGGSSGSGSGDVVGPSSAVDGEVALFSGSTGKIIKRMSATGIMKVTSGVAGIASMSDFGTGTPSSSTYLRGDGTWATPPGGGIGDVVSTAANTFAPSTSTTQSIKLNAHASASSGQKIFEWTNQSGVSMGSIVSDGRLFVNRPILVDGTLGGDIEVYNGGLVWIQAASTALNTDKVFRVDNQSGTLKTYVTADGSITTPSTFTLRDATDVTKQAQFVLSGITTGTTRTYTLPDRSDTLVDLGSTQTLTSKTLTTPTIASFTNATHNHQSAAGGGSLDAAAIGTGTIATARLGSGSANSTTFLRGDQTWATPAGGGTGDVTGPASSVDSEIALFSSTTGKIIKRMTGSGIVKVTSGVASIATAGTDYAAASHTHAAADIASGTIATARLGSGAASSSTFLRGDQTWATPSGSGDVTSNTATSVDSEIALFNSTTGKQIKRATGSGIAKLTSGVLSVVAAPAGTIVGDTDTQSLTNKTLSGTTNTISIQDNKFTLFDNADATKQVQFDLANITTGTTRTLMLPDVTAVELVATTATQTLANKTLTAPTIGDFTNATHTHLSAATGGVLTGYSQNLGQGWMTPPGPPVINATQATAIVSGNTSARYVGQCPYDCTQVEVKYVVNTAGVTITWAEMAVATGASATSGNLTLVGTAQNLNAVVNSTGVKTTTITASVPAGSHVYILFGSQATTMPQLRGTIADELSAGFVRFGTARPSTMAAPTSFSSSAATTYAAYYAVRFI